MEPIFLSLFANIIRMYAIYRCMEHFFLSKDENKISKICMYTGFVLVNSVGYYLFNNMFINISTNIIGLLFITTLYKCNFLSKRLNFRHGYKNPRPHFCNRSTLIIHI